MSVSDKTTDCFMYCVLFTSVLGTPWRPCDSLVLFLKSVLALRTTSFLEIAACKELLPGHEAGVEGRKQDF